MLPILLKLGPITIYSYGVFLFLGLFAGLYWFWKIGRDEHFGENEIFDIYFVSIFTYFLVGRVVYVLLNSELHNLWKALSIFAHPGVNVAAGIMGTIGVVIMLARRHEWDPWKVLDAWVVVLSTVLAIASIGAMLNGSNPGVLSPNWGYIHPGDTEPRVPLDVIGFVWSLITFGVVSRVRKNFRFYSWYKGEASVAKDGLTLLIWGVMVGVYMFVVGWGTQGGRWGGVVPPLSVYGLLVIVILSFVIYWRGGKKRGEMLLSRLRLRRSE